jgi:hypothetical protein
MQFIVHPIQLITLSCSPYCNTVNWIVNHTLLSNIRNLFPFFFDRDQHALQYVSVDLIRVLCNIHLVWLFKFGDFSCLLNS